MTAVGERAAKSSGSVLPTLASAQFLMTLDSSVMNVSIATVANDVGHDGHRDPDRHHHVHAGDGVAHDHRRQDRSDDRPQAGLGRGLRDLRDRFVHHRHLPEPHHVAVRMVAARGHRRRAHPARGRRAGGRELRPARSAEGLRPDRVGRRHRRRGRTAHRRTGHHLRLVALGVRRRGASSSSIILAARPADPRHATRSATPTST